MSVFRRLFNVGKGRWKVARRAPDADRESVLDAELAREQAPPRKVAASTPPAPEPEPEPAPDVDPYDPAAPDRKRTL